MGSRARWLRWVGSGVGIAALAAGIGGGVAAAANTHIHGTLPFGLGALPLRTGTVLPPGCTVLPLTAVIVPLSGNAVVHGNINKTGAWFTETITASAEIVTASTFAVLGTGHLTEWDGGALNQLSDPGKTTVVSHFTGNFEGTLTTGMAITIHGNGGSTAHDVTVTFTKTHPTTTPVYTTPGRVTSDHFNASCS